ncbi:MAG: hypothetical protein M1155_00630 [Patescibacteria group bacterium]|nr:hypothetical protein [Patescibacteria group bacterium]
MKKTFLTTITLFGLSMLLAKQTLAICPICTIAVGAGLGLSRWLGINDSITGLWIGGLTVSMITWTEDWFDRKNIHFKFRSWVTTIGYYLFVVAPLYFTGMLANPANAIYSTWLDPLIIGIIVGSLGFWLGVEWYYALKSKNNGRAYFPFQKVVMPISPLIIMSVIFYFLTK